MAMKLRPETALTFDDVLLVPKRSSIRSRHAVTTQTQFSRSIGLAVPLISDGDRSKDATKAKVRAVIRTLAGKTDAAAELQGVPGASRLAAATPDDLVLIAFAGVSFWIALALTRKRFRN